MRFITLLTRRFPLLPFNTICCSVIYSGPRAVDASGLFYSLVACTSPEIPRVQKCNSFQTQASDVNTATALPSPPPPLSCFQIQMFFISTRRTNLLHLISSLLSSLCHIICLSLSLLLLFSSICFRCLLTSLFKFKLSAETHSRTAAVLCPTLRAGALPPLSRTGFPTLFREKLQPLFPQ